mmetsp:Transcript_41908/g.108010  ORF Transcript_41908/g.108010 Transcript_41908/m.108010 type:complete len:320 (+) Transcript_41908:45-1004(+)
MRPFLSHVWRGSGVPCRGLPRCVDSCSDSVHVMRQVDLGASRGIVAQPTTGQHSGNEWGRGALVVFGAGSAALAFQSASAHPRCHCGAVEDEVERKLLGGHASWMGPVAARRAVELLHGCLFDDEMEDIRLYDLSEEEEREVEVSGSDSTYGEVTYELLEWALQRLPLSPSDVLCDLGSGGGRALLYLALRTGCDVVGVELSETRHNSAESLFHLAAPLLRPGQQATLWRGDMLDPSGPQHQSTLVLVANRLFDDDFTARALATTPSAKHVLALRAVPGWCGDDGTVVETALLPTTWMQRRRKSRGLIVREIAIEQLDQ